MDLEILYRSADEHRVALENREYSSLELTEAILAHIEKNDQNLGAFLTVDRKGALRAAKDSDARRASGKLLGPLDGIPYGVKDNFCTEGLRTTCASRMLEHFVPPYDATVIAKLKAAGAVLLGKQNMDEFAMGSSNEHSALRAVSNPHNAAYVPGGSSGGSAAAVSAAMGCFALGTDTGGSVRQPAAFCGVYGLKPTYGAISRYGAIEMATSLDSVGICSRTIGDCKTVFQTIAGVDRMDPTSRPCRNVEIPKRPVRIALLSGIDKNATENAVMDAVEDAKAVFARHGAEFFEVSLPAPEQALAAYSVLVAAECASNLARFDGVRYGYRTQNGEDLLSLYENTRAEGFGREVKRRILFGSYVLQSAHRADFYERAREVRRQVKRGMAHLFAQYDLLLSPTAPTAAVKFGTARTPQEMYQADLCTVYANLAGLPALSVPFGKNAQGLPLSVQLTAGAFREESLFYAAELLERECPPSVMRPACWEKEACEYGAV